MPQYNLGHLDRVATIRRKLAQYPRLYLAGIAFDGVGIPDCIHAAEMTADSLLDALANAAASAGANTKRVTSVPTETPLPRGAGLGRPRTSTPQFRFLRQCKTFQNSRRARPDSTSPHAIPPAGEARSGPRQARLFPISVRSCVEMPGDSGARTRITFGVGMVFALILEK